MRQHDSNGPNCLSHKSSFVFAVLLSLPSLFPQLNDAGLSFETLEDPANILAQGLKDTYYGDTSQFMIHPYPDALNLEFSLGEDMDEVRFPAK